MDKTRALKSDSVREDLFPHGVILLCRPTYFDVVYEINPWMHVGSNPDHLKVVHEFTELQQILNRLGAWLEFIPPQPGVPDLIYTANGGLIKGSKCVVSRFRHKERQGEEPYFKKWFEDYGFDTAYFPEIPFEGAGDALFLGDLLIAGYGIRSEKKAYEKILPFLEQDDTIFIELTDPRYYHLDLVVCPLNRNKVIVNREGMTPESFKELEKRAELILVEPEEASRFCVNAVLVGDSVVLPKGAPRLEAQLTKHGYTPVSVELSEIMKGGGASKCLTLRLK